MTQKSICILEDDPDISELVTYILSEAGYRVHQCATIGALMQILATQLPDLFVLDILLPDGNGLEVCRQLRTDLRTSHIPVLLMSANKTRKEVEEYGCTADFISKPFNIDHFRERVSCHMQ